jgi:hypothetical protein
MTVSRAKASVKSGASHRTYQDQSGTDTAFCRLVSSEDELRRLAAGADRIEVRQAPGAGLIPAGLVTPLVAALRSEDLGTSPADPRAERIERELRRLMNDALARIRIRFNRCLLAGLTRIFEDGQDQTVLVLVFARRGTESCEWKIAA